MKNRIKSYWSNCLSIAAIICSVVAICVSLPSAPELGIDYIGVIVGILSLLVTMLIGWQIWNVIAIDKKVKDEVKQVSKSFAKDIKEIKDESEISTKKILYKAEYIELKFQLSKYDLRGITICLKAMVEHAISINEPYFFSDVAAKILLSKEQASVVTISNGVRQIEVNNDFLEISQNLLNHLAASDRFTPALLKMVDNLKRDNEKIRKNIEKK